MRAGELQKMSKVWERMVPEVFGVQAVYLHIPVVSRNVRNISVCRGRADPIAELARSRASRSPSSPASQPLFAMRNVLGRETSRSMRFPSMVRRGTGYRFTSPSQLCQSCNCRERKERAQEKGSVAGHRIATNHGLCPEAPWSMTLLGVAESGSAEAGVGASSPVTPSCVRLHAPPSCRPVSGTAHGKAESPQAVSHAPLNPICLAIGEAKAAAPARPHHRFDGRIGLLDSALPSLFAAAGVWPRNVTCIPRHSCAGIRSDCSAIRTPRRSASKREEAPWCLRMC
ncbi:hypothetical protein N656DRAFT_518781 [Canariomyces notabilis]|uniref:Uncharacterized protein n=1 Tax=Canariomyces notabilis TaxID=2074819 RepID=A0AAN6QFK2_9PEZI|nr:hypothetical protein N656DRAFT_518781 [Canariomyces arenarius]